jgi:hypothetical protein
MSKEKKKIAANNQSVAQQSNTKNKSPLIVGNLLLIAGCARRGR